MIRFPAHMDRTLNQLFTVKDPPTQILIKEDEHGFSHATCSCNLFTRNKWCIHVQTVYSSSDENIRTFEPSPAVVVFVKAPWLIIPCITITSDVNPDLAQVTALWGNPHKKGKYEYEFRGADSIGFVNHEYNRKDLRRLLLEWLPGLQDLFPMEKWECTSSYHDAAASFNLAEWKSLQLRDWLPEDVIATPGGNMKYQDVMKRIYTESYNLLDTGRCVACEEVRYLDMEEV